MSPESERVVTEQDVNLKEFDVRLVPDIDNPFLVVNDLGRPIGTAVVTLVEGAFNFHFILDSHNPETFDLEVDPKRVGTGLYANVDGKEFFGVITLQTK